VPRFGALSLLQKTLHYKGGGSWCSGPCSHLRKGDNGCESEVKTDGHGHPAYGAFGTRRTGVWGLRVLTTAARHSTFRKVRSCVAARHLRRHNSEPVRRGWNKRGRGVGFENLFLARKLVFSCTLWPFTKSNAAVIIDPLKYHIEYTRAVSTYPLLTSTAAKFMAPNR
jgi:hypothetical protein